MEYKCILCNKDYSSYQSLWIHNKKYHKTKTKDNNTNTQSENKKVKSEKKFTCRFCNHMFTRKNNMVVHIKEKCKLADKDKYEKEELKNKVTELTKVVHQLQAKTNSNKVVNKITCGTFISGNLNNNLVINSIGFEDLAKLEQKEVISIFNKELEGIITYVELLNFNERIPENHSFCTTSLDSQYLSTYNHQTKMIDAERKKYFFQKLLSTSVEKIEILYTKNKKIFNTMKQKQIEENISNLKVIKDRSFNDPIIREIIKKFNMLSYNRKNIIQKTWLNQNEGSFLEELENNNTLEQHSNLLSFKEKSDDNTLSQSANDPSYNILDTFLPQNNRYSESDGDSNDDSDSDSSVRPKLVPTKRIIKKEITV